MRHNIDMCNVTLPGYICLQCQSTAGISPRSHAEVHQLILEGWVPDHGLHTVFMLTVALATIVLSFMIPGFFGFVGLWDC